MRMNRRTLLLLTVSFAAGCSIQQTIEPIKPTRVTQVCVLDNPKIFMDDFQPEMQRQIQAKGIATKVYSGARPSDCSHHLEYTANWQWDMAMYVTYVELRIYDTQGLAGQAIYDARRGGGRLDKFGRTAEKLRPLIDQLFGSVDAGAVAAPAAASAEVVPQGQSSDKAARLRELQRLKEQGLITDEEYAGKRQAILSEI